MAASTGIEWTDSTWNPLRGCSRVSEGCRNCYAEKVALRFSGPGLAYEGLAVLKNGHASWTGKVELVEKHLPDPMHWRAGVPVYQASTGRQVGWDSTRLRKIFVNSMSDLFHESVLDDWIDRIFAVMALCPQHQFQVLTKRPMRMLTYLEQACGRIADRAMFLRREWPRLLPNDISAICPLGFGKPGAAWWPLPNVWLGVSVENQAAADERIPRLLQTPAAVRFISAEPLLGAIDLEHLPSASGIGRHLDALSNAGVDSGALIPTKLDWVICGGESGPDARPMHTNWVRSLRDQCVGAGVPFFFKQWGEWRPPLEGERFDTSGGESAKPAAFLLEDSGVVNCFHHPGEKNAVPVVRVGKKAAGHVLDGCEWREFPGGAP